MKNRGFTLIELLAALVILAVAIAGLVSLWSFGFNTTRHSKDIGAAYSIARQEVEKARNIGYTALPETISTCYYDGLGNLITSPSPSTDASAHYQATTTLQTIPYNGEISTACLRTVNVRIIPHGQAGEGNEVLFESTSYLTLGGI